MTPPDGAVLVLGGNRFVGRRLVEMLRDRGTPVSAFHRSPDETAGVNVVVGDRERNSDLARAFAVDPSIVVDLSLYTGAQAHGTIPLIRERACRYIAVSSAVVYSTRTPAPWTEGSPINPAPIWGTYGRGKADADRAIREAPLTSALVLRPTYFIGARDPARRCASLFSRAAAGEDLLVPGDGSALIQIVDAEDMAAVLLEAVDSKINGVVNVGGSEPLSVRAFTELCAARVARNPRVRCVADLADDELDGERWPFPNATLHLSDECFREMFRHRCQTADGGIQRAFASWAQTSRAGESRNPATPADVS